MKKVQLIVDSGCDIPENFINDIHIVCLPSMITAGNQVFTDDGTIAESQFFTAHERNVTVQAPSSTEYFKAMQEADCSIVIPTSLESYSYANVGKKITLDKYPEKEIEIIEPVEANGLATRLLIDAARLLADTDYIKLVAVIVRELWLAQRTIRVNGDIDLQSVISLLNQEALENRTVVISYTDSQTEAEKIKEAILVQCPTVERIYTVKYGMVSMLRFSENAISITL